MRNIFRRQTETVAPTLRERAADLRASLRQIPATPAALPAPGSPEAMAAWQSACNEHSKRSAPLHEYAELMDPRGGFWTKGSLGRALETGEISVPEYARLHPIASERELRLDQIGHELNTAALFALAYAGEYPATSPASLNEADDDAELIRLGHLFEAARVREIAANEACNVAGREADRLMPPRPACLIYRASDNSLHVHQEMMMAEALAGREVRIQDIEWLRRKMPMRHEVLRPIREGERAHMDHPGRRFDIVPHPEAQARAEEIVTAWDAWEAERYRIYEKHVTEALENAADEAGRTAVALVEQIAGLPARTAAGFRVKLRALTHYRREILLAEIPAEPDPDQILTHSLWRDMRDEGPQDRTGEPQPTELPLSALVPTVDFAGASMRELMAIRDSADMLCSVANAAMSQSRNRLSDHPSGAVRLNQSGLLMRWLSDALCHVITAAEKEVRGRSPENGDDQQLRLSMLAVSTIDNDDPAETAAFARELLALAEH